MFNDDEHLRFRGPWTVDHTVLQKLLHQLHLPSVVDRVAGNPQNNIELLGFVELSLSPVGNRLDRIDEFLLLRLHGLPNARPADG